MQRTKYFVAHLLKGDAYWYHRCLTQALSERFPIVPVHEKAPPHITVKIPFEATSTELAGVEHLLQHFSEQYSKQTLTLGGFGRFGRRTIYLDAQHSEGSVALVRACVETLNELPWIQTVPHEGNKLHASVARFLKPKQFRRIWRLLKSEHPHFKEELDSLAILKKVPGESGWQMHREFMLSGHHTVPSTVLSQKLLQLQP